MPNNARFFLPRYGCAVLAVALATWVRVLLDPFLGTEFPFDTILFAVLLTAWYGGFRPALAAIVLGAIASDFFLFPPRGGFGPKSLDEPAGLVLFFFTSLGIALIGGIMHAALRRAEAGVKAERRQAALIDQTYDAVPNGMVMIDPEGKILLVNAQTEKLFGYSRDELLGQPVELLVPERFKGPHPGYREEFFANPQVRSMGSGRDLRGRRKNGSEFPVEIGLNPINTDKGLMVLSAIVDITERKRSEDVLRGSEARYRFLFERNLAGVLLTRGDGTILGANDAAAKIFGVASREELFRRHMREFYFDPAERASLTDAVAKDLTVTTREVCFRRADGQPVWTLGNISLFHDGPDGPVFQSTLFDITDRKKAEDLLRQLNAELEQWLEQLAQTNRELTAKSQENEAFVYSVSHDLRSPLVNLQGFSKELGRAVQDLRTLLLDNDRPQSARDRELEIVDGRMGKAIRFIQTAVTRLGNIIDALLRLSRAGRVIYQRKRVEVKDLVRRIVDSLEVTTKERGAAIRIDELPPVLGDPAAVEQIFANLIGNALNYLDATRPGQIDVGSVETSPLPAHHLTSSSTPPSTPSPTPPRSGEGSQSSLLPLSASGRGPGGGVASVFLPLSASGRGLGGGVASEPSEARLCTYFIRDNGLGITETGRAKVFQPFQRLHPQAAPGEGMGLAIVQRVVERLGGKIWFESFAGQGSTFFVALPAFLDGETPAASFQAAPAEKGSRST